jgi:hypothetical protein
MKHSRGVSLRELNRVTGRGYWRDENRADGGKRKLRRVVRRTSRHGWQRELEVRDPG